MSNYPASIDDGASLPNPGGNSYVNVVDHAGLHTGENTAIIALETKLGTLSSTPAAASPFLLATGTGQSQWSSAANARTSMGIGTVGILNTIDLTANVTGILPVTNGGTGTSSSSGSGSVVLNNSPTLITPTIANFANAQHSHQSTTGGGQLDYSALTTNSSWAWSAWSPAFTNITVGNGTLTGRFIQVGKTVCAMATFQTGSTTTFGGSTYILSLPVNAQAANGASGNFQIAGQWTMFDKVASVFYQGVLQFQNVGTSPTFIYLLASVSGGATNNLNQLKAINNGNFNPPVTGSGSYFDFRMIYEAA